MTEKRLANRRRVRGALAAAAALGLIGAMAGSALGARPSAIIAINNANAWLIVHDPDDPCEFDQITLTVAQDYSKSTGARGRPAFNSWADVSFGHWSGCEDPTISNEMYGQVNLDPNKDVAVNGLESAWVDTAITVEGGGATRTFTFDLAWVASGDPDTIVGHPDYAIGTTGRYVDAYLTGTVIDSNGAFTMEALDRAELSEVHVRLK